MGLSDMTIEQTTEGNIFASLLGEAAPSAEESTQDDTAKVTVESDKQTASTTEEQTQEAEDEILDTVSKDESEDDSEWDGKSPLHEHPRFKKLINQRNEERVARKEVEARVAELQGFAEVFEENYSNRFTDPENPNVAMDAFRFDVSFMNALEQLDKAGIKSVQQASVMVQEFMKTGKMPNVEKEVPQMSKSESTKNASDPVARELWTDRVDALLNGTTIKPELKTVIRKHAIAEFSGEKLSKAAAKEVISAYINENGWSVEFLTGKPSKAAASEKAKPATAKPASRVEPTSKKPQEKDSKSEITNPDELRDQMHRNLAELVAQSSGA